MNWLDMYPLNGYALVVITRVELSRRALRSLGTAPKHIATKLNFWVAQVESIGLEEVRRQRGFHDEPLKGDLVGMRSIRLSLQYRAIYVIKKDSVEFVQVKEVSPHKYGGSGR